MYADKNLPVPPGVKRHLGEMAPDTEIRPHMSLTRRQGLGTIFADSHTRTQNSLQTKHQVFCSELLFGTALKIPGEFFEDISYPVKPETFVQQLREKMRQIRPKPTVHHGSKTPFIHKNLEQATHVFVRDDSGPRPLQPTYQGPYEVLARINERLYTILIKDRPSNIAIERLKPAFLSATEEVDHVELHHNNHPEHKQKKVQFQVEL